MLQISIHDSPPQLEAKSLYVHVPFCQRRCGYCDFPLVVNRDYLTAEYLKAIDFELNSYHFKHPIETIFIGGGTPTHLDSQATDQLFSTIARACDRDINCEVTAEANPNDLNQQKIMQLTNLGVNRLSVGVQSFQSEKLKKLERTHSADQALKAVERLVNSNWNVSIDLIFAVHGDTLRSWREDLQTVVDLGIGHVSTYNLTIEKGTSFWSRRQHGQALEADEDLAAELYELAIDFLVAHGYQHYEVSNFCLPAQQCKHNLVYWKGDPWLGIGPGAASYCAGVRWRNHASPTTYVKRCQAGQSPTAQKDLLSSEQVARERLVFGLRQIQGVSLVEFSDSTGFQLLELGGSKLARWIQDGFLIVDSSHIRLTRKGLLLSDSIWPDLL